LHLKIFDKLNFFNTFTPGYFGDFRKKNQNACGFVREFLRSGKRYRPGQSLKRHGKSSSLHSKKNVWLEKADFL